MRTMIATLALFASAALTRADNWIVFGARATIRIVSPRQGKCLSCLVAFCLGWLTSCGAAVAAERPAIEAPAIAKEVEGKVKALDLEQGVITLLLGDEDDAPLIEQKYSLHGKDIRVSTQFGERPELTLVKPGLGVILGLSADDDVVGISIMSPRQRGKIKAIEPGRQLLAISAIEPAAEQKLTLAKSVKVRMDKEELSVKDLCTGISATFVLSLDRTTVHQILVSMRPEPSALHGALVKVDAKSHSIQLVCGSSGRYSLRTFPLANDFRFFFNRKLYKPALNDLSQAINLETLPRALPVWLIMDEKRQTVFAIGASSPVITGVVQGVEASSGVITVATSMGAEKFTVLNGAEIILDDRRLKLAEVNTGTAVELLLGINRTEVVAIRSVDEDD